MTARIYLDNAATSWPKPPEVYNAVVGYMRDKGGNPGRACHRSALEAEGVVKDARLLVARLLGAVSPNHVVFTLNATDALNMALKGFLSRGDRVLMSGLEHNSVTRPLRRLAADGFIELAVAEPDAEGLVPLERWEALLQQAPSRLVCVTHASNVLGTIQPVAELSALAHRHGAAILVDAAQTAGHLPIDAKTWGVDLLAFAGHKGLLGPQGVGGLLVGENVTLRAWREGGTGGDSVEPLQPEELPHALEAGTPNTPGLAGLAAGIRWLRSRGLEVLRAEEIRLTQRLLDALRDDPRFEVFGPASAEARCGVVSLRVKPEWGLTPLTLGTILDVEYGIAGRSGVHCAPLCHDYLGTLPEGLNRFSLGPFTTEADIDTLLSALDTIVPTSR